MTTQALTATPTLIDLALAITDKCLDFRITMQPDQAREYVIRTEGYNEYTPRRAAALLAEIDTIIPRAQYPTPAGFDTNPNNGKQLYTVSVGREGSMVIYVHAHYYFQQHAATTWPAVIAALKAAGHRARADEVTADQEEHAFTMRYWWD